jgi:hypothetical protein
MGEFSGVNVFLWDWDAEMIFLMGKSESKPLMENRFFIEGFTPHISQNITPHHRKSGDRVGTNWFF